MRCSCQTKNFVPHIHELCTPNSHIVKITRELINNAKACG